MHSKAYEFWIVLALIMAPFTDLRFMENGVGISESIFIVLFFYLLWKMHNGFCPVKNFPIVKMFLVLIASFFVGYIFNYFFLDDYGGGIKSAIFNLAAYICGLIACYVVSAGIELNIMEPFSVIKKFFIAFGILHSILFILSFFTDSLFGFNLRYAGICYGPFASNLHQIGMYVIFMPFLGMYVCEKTDMHRDSLIFLVGMMLCVGLNVAASKIWFSYICSFLWLLFFSFFNRFEYRSKVVLVGLIFFIALGLMVMQYDFFIELFKENDLRGGREFLYFTALETFLESPIFGYGPVSAVYVGGGFWMDAHSTISTIALSGGILALFFVVFYLYKVLEEILKNKFLFATLIGILMYFIFGDILRKPGIWVSLTLLYNCALREYDIDDNAETNG